MKKRGLIFIIILVLLIPFTQAENYANYGTAEIELSLNSKINIRETGPNPKLIEAEGILNLIPLETDYQEILNLKIYSEPEADITKEKDKIIYNWRNIKENKITYGVESEVKTKNRPLIIKDKIRYPTSFESKYYKYIEEEKYINTNTEIQNLADELFKGETDLFHAVYKTAKWIEKNIEYRRTKETESKVKKSSWVLQNKYGVCDELTNLFISILRAKNIPTRFISGTVYSARNEKFENHGWAEVYFPEYGWLPFDITYLQYGWADISHIKLAESTDSGISSIDYHWRSSDINIEIGKLDISADIKKQGDKIPLVTTAIEPIKTKVGFNSYVPIIVTVENPTSFYLTPHVYLTKSPQILNKNKQTLFLKPKEVKSIYFIAKLPTNLNENYIYRSELEAETSFGEPVSSMLEFSSDHTIMTKEEAENIVAKYTAKEAKRLFIGIDFDCTTRDPRYYENEDIEVICVIKNKEKDTKDLHVCLINNCKGITLTELEEKITTFKTKSTNKIILTAEDEDEIKYSTINLNIIKIPNIIVKNIEPLIIDYHEEVDLKIEIETTIPSYNTTIYLGKREILNTPLLQGKRIITTKVRGKDLIKDIRLKMIYKDKLNKEYTKTNKYLVTIKNKPWYIWLFGWVL